MMLTICGMGRAVAQLIDAVTSTTHHGSVQNLINKLRMTLSYDCMLIRTLIMKIFN